MKHKISIVFTTVLVLLSIIFLIVSNNFKKTNSFTIVMAGDTLVTNSILSDGYNKVTNEYNFSKMFSYVKNYIKDYDLAFYNQETLIGGTNFPYTGTGCYNTPSNFAIDMMNVGFNMVNLANNHSLDGKLVLKENDSYTCENNEQGIINSINFWKYYESIYSTGLFTSKEEQNSIIIKELNGIKYTLLSYTYGTNMDDIIEYQPYLVNIYSDEKAKEDIEKVKDKVDVIFVSMHWGEENNVIPSETQKKQASYLASLGVDVIIGHHPHVVQPIEKINDTLVIYSLGNLITGQSADYDYNRLIGMLVGLKITKSNNEIKIDNINCELTYINYDENKSNFIVLPYSYITDKEDEKYKRLYQRVSKIVKLYDDSIIINKIGTKKINLNTE